MVPSIQQRYLVGIDAGGSKTLGLLANQEGSVLYRARAGGANLQLHGRSGVTASFRLIFDQLDAAAREAGLGDVHQTVARGAEGVCLGIAGADRAPERAEVQSLLFELGVSSRATIVHDAEIALAAGLGPVGRNASAAVGIVIIAGTGAISYGVDPAGKRARSGGWGYLLGDEGSGFWLGQQVLRRSLMSLDGRGKPTLLTGAVARRLKLSSPRELVAWVYGQAAPQERFAKLLPIVQEAVEQDDAVAREILEEAAIHLASASRAVWEQLDLSQVDPIPLIAAGGAFKGCPSLVQALERQTKIPGAEVRLLEAEPALGAVYLAMARLGSS